MKSLYLLLGFSLLINSALSRIPERTAKGDFLGIAKDSRFFSADGLWHFLDPIKSKVHGVSVTKTYDKFKIHSSAKEIIVAVIDSGVDVRHSDLRGKVWVNKGEIWDNGIDDDENGYVDDIFGWNFIGNSKGMAKITDDDNNPENGFSYELGDEKYQVTADTFELTRELKRMRALAKTRPLVAEEAAYLATLEEEYKIASNDGLSPHYFDLNFNSREIVGDNYADQKETNYGNNDVIADIERAFHGTHVSGIIAAVRDNKDVTKGIASKVKIMCIRAVPDGDERDKDVANAIKYAVSNGAHIINMSFGKGYDFNKKVVDEAVAYAESKGVILVHAAGNSAQNNDSTPSFPNRKNSLSKNAKEFSNWIEVGASGPSQSSLPAYFSNYGKKTVDLFAPGEQILSLAPNNKYAPADGTSMASPVVAGVLAAILNFVPAATTIQAKEALLKTVRPYPSLMVSHAGQDREFATLSITGGVADLFDAVSELKNKGFDVEPNLSPNSSEPSSSRKWGKN